MVHPDKFKRLSLLKNSVLLKHALGWVAYFLYYIFVTYIRLPDFDLIDLLLQHVVMIGVFYALIYLAYDTFLTRKKYLLGFLWFLLIAAAYVVVRYVVVYKLIPIFSKGEYHYDPKVYVSTTIALFVNFCAYSAVYWLVRNSIRKEYQLRVAERGRLEMEKAKVQSEYAFLKAQVSPHFLHNTLNFLYAKVLPYSRQLSDSVLLLSKIMRYALNEDELPDGKTLLIRELEHIRNIITINQLRFSNQLQIQLQVIGEIEGVRVIPFILMTLVENVFKHGELHESENPIKIYLQVDRAAKKLYLETSNKKTGTKAELSTGIGLNNLKKRLEWGYGEAYIFTIKEDDLYYTAHLELQIDEP